MLLLQVAVIKDYLIYFFTYSFNYVLYNYDVPPNPVNHFWSLCFEEQFYIVWPFIILLWKKNYKTLVIISSIVVVFCFAQLTLRHLVGAIDYRKIGLFSSIGFLAIGGLAAILFNKAKIPTVILSNKYIECATWFLLVFSLVTNFPTKYIFLAYCSVFVVLKSTSSDFHFTFANKLLTNRSVIFIGTISYGIYIYHLPVAYFFEQYVFNPLWSNIDFSKLGFFKKIQWYSWLIKLPLYTAISIWIAYISYKYIEQPILQLKDKYFAKQ